MKKTQLRVWWIPQVPGKPFYVNVDSLSEGFKLCNTLALYDLFQYENRIKPDYSNMGGLEYLDGEWGSIDENDMEWFTTEYEVIKHEF